MKLIKSLVLFCSSLGLAHASVLGAAGDYNVLTFGDFSSSSDSEGRIAVGGNATLTNFGVGGSLGGYSASDPYTVVVGGNLTYQNATVDNGGIAVGGTTSLTNIAVNGNVSSVGALTTQNGQINGTVSAPSWSNTNTGGPSGTSGSPAAISSVVNFTSLQNTLDNDSKYWGTLTQTGTVATAYGALTLTGTSSGLNVFNITSAQLSTATSGITINAPAGSTVLVNVDGVSDSFPNTGYTLNGVANTGVIFNFDDATTLSGSGGFQGSILAPLASFNFNNGQINGQVVALSMSGSGETHDDPFNGNLPSPVPEPGSIILLSTGAVMMLGGKLLARKSLARKSLLSKNAL